MKEYLKKNEGRDVNTLKWNTIQRGNKKKKNKKTYPVYKIMPWRLRWQPVYSREIKNGKVQDLAS